MDNIIYSLSIVGPVFLIIGIGVLLRGFNLVDQPLSDRLSRLVFWVFLPALILRTMSHTDLTAMFSFRLVFVAWGTLAAGTPVAWMLAMAAGVKRDERGLFASGSTWSNVAIIGYALGEALYGEEGLARAAIFSALVLPVHILLGYFVMDRELFRGGGGGKTILKRLAVNPVMLAILFGAGLSFIPAGIPTVLDDVLGILGRASLPLALVAIGGSLEFREGFREWKEPLAAAGMKLILMPSLAYIMAAAIGLSPDWTGTVVVGFSCPTAVSFFVISRSLGHDAAKSASIVTATTLGAAFTAGVVAFVLKTAGLV